MADDGTTYRIVDQNGRSSKTPAATTVRTGTAPPPNAPPPESEEPESEEPESEEHSRHTLAVRDIEQLLDGGDYDKVCALLGPPERAAALPPELALLYIAARGERGHGPELADLPHLAMETSGKLLDMPASSRVSRLLAKRLLGLSTASVRGRLAPARERVGLLVLALAVGVVVGFIAGRLG